MEDIIKNAGQMNDREIWIKENQLYVGDDNIIYDIAKGETDEEIALGIKKAILKLASLDPGKANLCVDLSKAGKPSPAARKIYLSITENKKIGKIALVGLHPVAQVLASSITTLSGKKDLRFFKYKKSAEAWLKGTD